MSVQLRADREALEKLWEQGLTGQELLRHHSKLVDEFIVECFESAELEGVRGQVALLALGGYGRKELFPFSDIDLMILFHPDIEDRVGEVVDAILYPLWDTGLEVGHGVRTISQSMDHAEEDYFFQVSMLDARLIYGSQSLFDDLVGKYREKYISGHREGFVEEMKRHRDRRRERYGSHSFLLEPHIKEGKGGMRDIQSMYWVARVVFGLRGLHDFSAAGLMLEEEQSEFLESWDALVQLRNRLHYFSRRKNDQLYFELQEEVAEALGYVVVDGVLGVEQFMRDTYAHMENVAITVDLFFDHVDEVLGLVRRSGPVIQDREVEKGIEIRRGRVHLTALPRQIAAKPQLMMRAFLAFARSGVPLHHRTRKLISSSLEMVNDKMRTSPRMSKALVNILESAKDVFGVLEVMLETGLLSAYVPEFCKIETLAQHDIYHIYTVDRHSLQAVAELRTVIDEEPQVYALVKMPQMLFLAALLHDIGKGSGRDHSEEGAEVAARVARRMSFSDEEVENLAFLIKYHLFVPENALRRDLNDVAFIKRCAGEIGDVSRLAMLYLLSVADSRATGPSAWSDWKAALMQEMFFKVRSSLETMEVVPGDNTILGEHVEQNVGWLREQVSELLADEKDVRIDLASLPNDYILTFSPETVKQHICVHRDNYRLLRQKSLVVAEDRDDYWSLLVMSLDRPGLLAKICGVLSLHNLTVVRARIFTWDDGTVVDILEVRPTDGLRFVEKEWKAVNDDLDKAISHRLGLGHRLYQKLTSTYGRRTDLVSKVEPRVVIDNSSSDEFSVIEVYSGDLPGLLYHITQTLADFGMNIHKAIIATEVEQLIDIFYVLDSSGKKIVDQDFQKEITQGLLYSLGRSEK
ncbi:[protein-PII] uridylyltransferase [Desulfosediminicola flagellatus]|uniref:[protein-PII] uridylyltransferase n=1 Tax=Desulfosediminicola flagellatus TaxID=2569541 RepID=UPI0010ACBC97|nr:[protein-PII] uridylyltransferase [Desulfosediminicola flagellatus]